MFHFIPHYYLCFISYEIFCLTCLIMKSKQLTLKTEIYPIFVVKLTNLTVRASMTKLAVASVVHSGGGVWPAGASVLARVRTAWIEWSSFPHRRWDSVLAELARETRCAGANGGFGFRNATASIATLALNELFILKSKFSCYLSFSL